MKAKRVIHISYLVESILVYFTLLRLPVYPQTYICYSKFTIETYFGSHSLGD